MTIDKLTKGSLIQFKSGKVTFYGIIEDFNLWNAIGENRAYAVYFKGRSEPIWFDARANVTLVTGTN